MAELTFGSYHLRPDPDLHVAGYGARLIYAEVADGYGNAVPGRSSDFGTEEDFALIQPVLAEWKTKVRALMATYRMNSSSKEVVELRDGRVVVAGSPQGSYGYLYVTALVEKVS